MHAWVRGVKLKDLDVMSGVEFEAWLAVLHAASALHPNAGREP
jgi:hypothetical protein